MSRKSSSQEFSMLVGSAIVLGVALLLLLLSLSPLASAEPPDLINPHSRAFLDSLDGQQRKVLKEELRQHLTRFTSSEDLDAVPYHQIYLGVLLDLLMKPALAAQLSEPDRKLVVNLPLPGHRQFAARSRPAMAAACRVIEGPSAANPAAAAQAVQALQRARHQINRWLDNYYRQALAGLSQPGRELVTGQVEKLRDGDVLVATELDLAGLSFTRPRFVQAFLLDTCQNSVRRWREHPDSDATLGDQLIADFERGAVQIYQPQ
ncbi:MAG: hypothetical protein R3F41_14520 [Gammaproteobacteria bacterium]|nr:hypothetical protein [Pseudomonadales bacterium]MCP5347192.1 hypothetical protein [Pseudomonadales bacterium]